MIDIHTHLHPPRLSAAIRRWFAEHSDWDIAFQPSDPQAIAAVLRENGVERFVFCSYAHKPGIARELNAWLAAASRELDRYGLPLATVHLDDPGYVNDFSAALDDGCVGIKIHEDVQRLWIDDPRFEPILGIAEWRGAFILVHVGHIPWSDDTRDGPRRIAAVLQRHPNLNIVVAHMGMPDTLRYFALMDQYSGLYLDTTMGVAPDSPMRRRDIAELPIVEHADRIVLGTDFPNIPYGYGSESAGVRALGLPPEQTAQILHGNAAALLARWM